MADATEFSPLGSLDVASLHDGFRGELLRPEDAGYENARNLAHQAMFDPSFPTGGGTTFGPAT